MKKRNVALISAAAIMALGSIGAGIGFTYAGFVGKTKIDAPLGGGNVVGTYIFLDTGIWTEEVGGASFCIDVWPSGGSPHTFVPNAAQTSDGYLVFNIDLDLYNGGAFQFVRYNDANVLNPNSWEHAVGIIYNVSVVFAISERSITGADGKNLYTISGWGDVALKDDSGDYLGTVAVGSWTDTLVDE